jgi:hypothetical protein
MHAFLILTLVASGWSALRPGRFNPPSPRYPLYRRLGGPWNRCGECGKIIPDPTEN